MHRLTILAISLLTLALASPVARADARTDQRLEESRAVFESFTFLTEQSIPTWLLERSYGIIVLPRVIKGALILGGRGGRGVMAVRNPDGSWSYPVFVTLGGANIGFQWGVQSTELVLVLMSERSVEGIAGGKVTLGADASVAAGPLGRSASANTDAQFKAQVLSYARSEGLFFGVALDGSVISVDDKSNWSAYEQADLMASEILDGKARTVPAAARDFTAALTRATAAVEGTTPPAAAPPPTTTPPTTATTPAAPKDGEDAKTFPMEDSQPGAPPPQ